MGSVVIQKFGGTSVASIEHIKDVVFFVKSAIKSGYRPVVVVSAMAGVTNSLVAMCSEISSLDSREKLANSDAAFASGESVSAALFALALQEAGIGAKSIAGWQIPIITSSDYSKAIVESIKPEPIERIIGSGCVPVIAGFQGVDKNGQITTLGRGGSDTSAAVLAAALGSEICDIYSDVDGMYDADPRVVSSASKIDKLSPAQAVNFAGNGAKILHVRAAQVAAMYGLKIRILSSFNKCDNYLDLENNEGTLITEMEQIEKTKIIGITSKQNFCLVSISAEDGRSNLVSKLMKQDIDFHCLMHLSAGALALIIDKKLQAKTESLLDAMKQSSEISDFSLNTQIVQISLVGHRISADSKIILEIYDLLAAQDVEIYGIQTDDSSIKITMDAVKSEKIIKLLHKNLIEQKA